MSQKMLIFHFTAESKVEKELGDPVMEIWQLQDQRADSSREHASDRNDKMLALFFE